MSEAQSGLPTQETRLPCPSSRSTSSPPVLGAPIGLFAPEVNEAPWRRWRGLVTVKDPTPGTTPAREPQVEEQPFRFEYWMGGESAERWELPADQRPARIPAPEACGMLVEALQEARSVLGG